ncbi:E3 ubiquitin-protein ligase RHF1A-like [Gastrolobium bilobum]|uniref:E3 ubiquitin-protein ligase RHF1A-like n=1 Tax=Gastrolobium bilobum TaxID=150636 RepID=UPI002AB1C010|nr:E3 ubiquitin-protein ligase RHF1A-like [Gastrolobium bilobum]
MANFTSSSPPPSPSLPHISAPSSSAPFDDSSEDACSICLEPFSTDDPATITSCRHEYHLHCILEWSQRSKECPICWQLLVMKDSASQELLTAVEAERRLRSRDVYSYPFTNSRSSLERLNDDHGDSSSDYSHFDEQLMQHRVAAANRAHYVTTRERQRSSGTGSSEFIAFNSSVHASGMHSILTTSPSEGSSPSSGVASAADFQPPPSAFFPVNMVAGNITSESDAPFKPRVLYGLPPPESARRLNTSEMLSLPESIKSKLSAASARYKESISKSTRGLKEKLIARNASVKELSKGVQREMNAGIAGVTRMIERLDLTSKRSTSPLIPVSTHGGTSSFPMEGKFVQENGIGQFFTEESGVVVRDVSSEAPSPVCSLVANGVEIHPSCVQSGHDAEKTKHGWSNPPRRQSQ